MYFCYIDESGHCGEKFNPKQPVEVVVGVLTDVSKLFKTQREHGKTLSRLKKSGIDVSELKGQEIYARGGPWKTIDPQDRNNIITETLNWAEERSCKFIVCPIDSQKFFQLKEEGNGISRKLLFPYEAGAINVCLAVQRLKNGVANNKGKTIIVLDEQQGHDKNILKLMDTDEGLAFTDCYVNYVVNKRVKNPIPRLNEIIDIPFFSKSHISTLIQLADISAFIVNRYLLLFSYGEKEFYSGEKNIISDWYSRIGKNTITHSHINPPTKNDALCDFYRMIRPARWNPKEWFVKENFLEQAHAVEAQSQIPNSN